MNYVRWNFGDWDAAVSMLSDAEELAYHRLLKWYYVNEMPLPDDEKAVCKIAKLRSSKGFLIKALLSRFFHLQDGNWHHKRVDKELARYHAGQPAREQRKLEAKLRGARYFIGHKAARDFLKGHGVDGLHRGITMDHLKNIAQKLGVLEPMQRALQDAQDAYKNAALPQAVNARLQSPETQRFSTTTAAHVSDVSPKSAETRQNHKPVTINKGNALYIPQNAAFAASAPADAAAAAVAVVCVEQPIEKEPETETAEAIARHARAAGIAYANPRDDLLRVLVGNGATLDDFAVAVAQAKATDKGWAYVLGIVRERQADALRMRQQAPQTGLNGANGNADIAQAVPQPPGPLTPFVTAEIANDPERVRQLLAPLRDALTKR